MASPELLSRHEAAALRAVRAGRLQRLGASLAESRPDGDAVLYAALRRCEQGGLLRSQRDRRGRHYSLTPAGRARLRQHTRFERALLALFARSV